MKPLRSLVILLSCFLGGRVSAAEEWAPKDTYGVIAGVLKWEKNSAGSFSDRNRKDQELRDLLVERGTPAKNISMLLDEQATLAAIRRELKAVAEKAKPGSTFLFYYCGHGSPKAGKGVCFLNYDCAGGKPTLAVSEVADILKKHFKGSRVLLMADCCYSGGLGGVAEELQKAGFKAASLTSADSSNASTSNWTFTQSVIDSLRGEPLVDANADGTVTLGEAAREVARGMAYRERQRHGHAFCGVGADFRLGPTDRTRKLTAAAKDGFRLGDYVTAPDKSGRRPARVVGWEDGQYAVEFYDYSDKRVVRLPSDRLEKIPYASYDVGKEVTVVWGGKSSRAKVLKVDADFLLVASGDGGRGKEEWVLSNRIVPEAKAPVAVAEVKWEGEWYPAHVLQTKGDKYYITYVGYDSSWDEWVGKDRIRFPKKP